MPTQTDLCNLALARVGAARIASIDDVDSKGARTCLIAWESIVREVARSGEWNCLKRRDTLGRLAAAPAFEWAYQYQLPADLITLVELNGVSYHGENQDEWEIEGRVLLTDAEIAQVRYIAYVTDVSQWDSLFANAVVVLLAARIAVSIRQDEALAAGLMNEYRNDALAKARMRDGNERRAFRFDPTRKSSWVNARYASTNDGA